MKQNDIKQFNNIKDNIRNHSARILQKWVDRVESRNLDTSEMMTYLKATHDLSGGEMMKLMATVFSFLEYRSMHSFMKDFRCVASEIERVFTIVNLRSLLRAAFASNLSDVKKDKKNIKTNCVLQWFQTRGDLYWWPRSCPCPSQILV